MKIVKEPDARTQSGGNTIYVGERIDKIIQKLNDAKCIMGDDKAQRRKLTMAQMSLNRLTSNLRAETADIVYFDGTIDEFMSSFNGVIE